MSRAPVLVAAAAAAAIVFASPLAHADLSVTLAPVADTTLYQSPTGALGNGAGSAFFAGLNSQSAIRRGLIRFDLAASLPAGVTITNVELVLTNSAANLTTNSVRVHRALESWGEGASAAGSGGGGGAPAQPGDATWLHRFSANSLWSLAGGAFDAVASAQISVAGPGVYTWSSAGLIADAQLFLDQPNLNAGWFLLGNESSANSAKRFASREEADVLARPRLVVTYVPAPGAAMLLTGLFAPALRRARRTRKG